MDEMKLTNKVANLLWEAENNKQAIEPITETYPQLEVDHAYEIQLINIKRKLTTGRVVQGHKVGLSSKAMQKRMNVNVSQGLEMILQKGKSNKKFKLYMRILYNWSKH